MEVNTFMIRLVSCVNEFSDERIRLL